MESNSEKSSESLSYFTGKVAPTVLELSSDLKSIFEKQVNCDLTLFVGDKIIKCHKAILSARSKWFAFRILQSHSDGTSSIIMNENEQILDALLVYMYTGNLRLVESLKVPLLDLREATTLYGMERFKKLLTRMIKSGEKPGLKKTREFLWKVNIEDCKSTISVFPLEGFSLDGTDKWCLKMRPLCYYQIKYAFWVYVTRVTRMSNRKIIHIANLEMHILDSTGKRRRSFVGDHIFKKDGESKMSEHISLCKLEEDFEDLLPDDILSLSGQLTVTAKDLTSSQSMLFQIKGEHEKGVTNELHALSYDMHKLLKASKYTDLGIFTKGSSSFKANVHSYILSARSLIPIRIIGNLIEHGCSGSIVWRSFIHYVYTGQPRYLEDHMREIYVVSCKLRLDETKKKYSRILADNLTEMNVFDILTDAAAYEDTELVYSGLTYVAHNDVIDHPTWIRFAGSYPQWTREIMKATRHKKCKLNT